MGAAAAGTYSGIKDIYKDVKGVISSGEGTSKKVTVQALREGVVLLAAGQIRIIVTVAVEKHKNKIYSILPFIHGHILGLVDSVSSINKIILGVLTITIILLYCLINIIGYFCVLYLIKHTE